MWYSGWTPSLGLEGWGYAVADGGQEVDVAAVWGGQDLRLALTVTVWPDRALEETTKLAEAGVVGGGRRWWSFWLPEALCDIAAS